MALINNNYIIILKRLQTNFNSSKMEIMSQSKIKVTYLNNGIKVCVRHVDFAKSIFINIDVFGAGSYYAPAAISETAHLLEHLIFEGSKKYPLSNDAHQAIEANGSYFNATTYRDLISYYLHSPIDGFQSSFSAFVDAIFNPIFSNKSIVSEKEIVKEELMGYIDNDDRNVSNKISKSLKRQNYPSTRQSIKQVDIISRQDIIDHYQRSHLGNNITVYLTGNLELSLLNWIISQLNSIKINKGKSPDKEILPNYQPGQPILINKASKSNIYFLFGRYNLDQIYDGDIINLSILLNYLFNYPKSVLTNEARRRGLSYYLDYSFIDTETERRFEIFGEVSEVNSLSLWKLMINNLTMSIDNISQEDFLEVKQYTKGVLDLSMEDVSAIHDRSISLFPIYHDAPSYEQSQKSLDHISLMEFKRVAKNYFSGGIAQSGIVGPKKMIDNNEVKECLENVKVSLMNI